MQDRFDWIINYKKILISILLFNRECIFSFFLYECTCISQYTYACNLCKYMTYIVSYISRYIVSVFAFVKYFVQLPNVTMKINYISQNEKKNREQFNESSNVQEFEDEFSKNRYQTLWTSLSANKQLSHYFINIAFAIFYIRYIPVLHLTLLSYLDVRASHSVVTNRSIRFHRYAMHFLTSIPNRYETRCNVYRQRHSIVFSPSHAFFFFFLTYSPYRNGNHPLLVDVFILRTPSNSEFQLDSRVRAV